MRPIPGTVTDPNLSSLIPKPIIDRDPGDETDADRLRRKAQELLDEHTRTLEKLGHLRRELHRIGLK